MKITFAFAAPLPWSQLAANIAHNQALGLGLVDSEAERIAVVGGDPFVGQHVETLRQWPGEVWAINGAWRWCRDHGIDAVAFTVDPSPSIAGMFAGAARVLASNTVAPEVHGRLARGARVELFASGEGNVVHGTTTATAAAHLAVVRGHRHVTWFGCCGNYADDGRTHVDRSERTSLMRVAVGGGEFLTSPQMLDQSVWLAELIRLLPAIYAERSGGLLAALIEHGDHDVIAASRGIHEAIKRAA